MIAMRERLLLVLCLICAGAQGTWAQERSEQAPVANKEVLEMLKAGMSPDVVLANIKTSICQFDTSPSALVMLKEAGVPDAVLLEMIRHPNGVPLPAKSTSPEITVPKLPEKEQTEAVDDGLPEYGDISEIRRMRKVYVVADDI